MDVAERELDRMIERRARNGEVDPDEREELWQQSVRLYNARRREENRREWAEYHLGQADRLRANLEALVSYHQREADKHQPKGA